MLWLVEDDFEESDDARAEKGEKLLFSFRDEHHLEGDVWEVEVEDRKLGKLRVALCSIDAELPIEVESEDLELPVAIDIVDDDSADRFFEVIVVEDEALRKFLVLDILEGDEVADGRPRDERELFVLEKAKGGNRKVVFFFCVDFLGS